MQTSQAEKSSASKMADQPQQNHPSRIKLSCALPSRCTWSLKTEEKSPHRHVAYKPRPKISDTVLDCVGHTPLVRLNRIPSNYGLQCEILAKCEFFNAGGSVKDRIALRMIEEAEAKGQIKPGYTLIEPTSGNTGIGIALAAAVKGYRCIIVMPEKMSAEKADVLKILGAEIIRTPTNVASDSPDSHIMVAERLSKSIPNAFVLDQYRNPGNPLAHYDKTAEEILDQCDGRLDMVVAGVGTGGTITGIARKIKERLPNCQIVGVDPHGSILAHHESEDVAEGFYEVEGIGYDFIPTVLDKSLIDSWVKTVDKESFLMARQLILHEGLLCGGSSGAAMSAAVRAASELGKGKRVVVLLPDGIRNYMSKFVNEEWMLQRNYVESTLEEPLEPNQHAPWYYSLKISALPIVSRLQTIDSDMRIHVAIDLMKTHGFDQLPVVRKLTGELVGVITMQMALTSMIGRKLSFDDSVERCVTNDFPKLSAEESVGKLSRLLKRFHFVLIVHQNEEEHREKVAGIVTHVDILNYLLQASPAAN